MGYAIHGFSPDEGERPAQRTDKPKEDAVVDNTDCCYEIGLLRQGIICKLGNAAELKNVQPYVLREMVLRTMANEYSANVIKDAVSDAEDDYLRTLDEITARLKRDSSDKPTQRVELDDKDRRDDEYTHEHVKCPVA